MSSALVHNVRGEALRSPAKDRACRLLLIAVVVVQAAHFGAASLAHRVIASNILQAIVPFLSAAVCGLQALNAGARRQRRLWLQLSLAFIFWAVGQLFFLWILLGGDKRPLTFASDSLWLVFCLPLLTVAASPPESTRRDRVGWLDMAQSCLLFAILFVLVFPHPGIIRTPLAYDVEDLASFFAVLLRYSISQPGEERSFYRVIVLFAGIYSGCTALGYVLIDRGAPDGSLVDLCWTLPFTVFSLVSLSGKGLRQQLERWAGRELAFPQHLHGASALGMAVMSLAGSLILARHSLAAGVAALTVSFLLFAARTSTREWQLHSAHARLEHTVLHDPLTGLANRTRVQRELTRLLDSATGSSGLRTALLFIDLDRFKTINDGLGHGFGDRLLVEVASRLHCVARPGDLVARHGGDEFVVLLGQVDEQEAEAFARRVGDVLRDPITLEGRSMHVTASIGVVLSDPDATSESMLQDADCAMYKAKGSGKDRAQTFDPHMLVAARHTLELETDLRKALALHQIEVHYQPIFALNDMSIQGFEALARWRHPARGMVSPGDFIPIAEDAGLILELGRQVLEQACHQCRLWNDRFHARMPISVNVSARQFARPGLLDEIAASLRFSRLDPTLLKLEITESVLISSYQAVEETLTRARELGIAICLDDFGTGYSSLSYLLHFPFDIVKIDRSFVRNLDQDHRQAEILRMILDLAGKLDKQIVAEGVETQGELAELRAFGCDMVQGFLLSKPLPASAIETLLLSGVPFPLDEHPSATEPLPVPAPPGMLQPWPAVAAALAPGALPVDAFAPSSLPALTRPGLSNSRPEPLHG